MTSPLHKPAPHESGYLHASGAARYVDDLPPPHGMLVAQTFFSPVSRGRIVNLDCTLARQVDGIAAIITADDIPGVNDIAPLAHDEELLATNEVFTISLKVPAFMSL